MEWWNHLRPRVISLQERHSVLFPVFLLEKINKILLSQKNWLLNHPLWDKVLHNTSSDVHQPEAGIHWKWPLVNCAKNSAVCREGQCTVLLLPSCVHLWVNMNYVILQIVCTSNFMRQTLSFSRATVWSRDKDERKMCYCASEFPKNSFQKSCRFILWFLFSIKQYSVVVLWKEVLTYSSSRSPLHWGLFSFYKHINHKRWVFKGTEDKWWNGITTIEWKENPFDWLIHLVGLNRMELCTKWIFSYSALFAILRELQLHLSCCCFPFHLERGEIVRMLVILFVNNNLLYLIKGRRSLCLVV